MSIAELADAAGVSARAVRFYVQQKLLPPPLGRGRGSHYDPDHLARLRRIIELQNAGHSLQAVRQVLEGGQPTPAPTVPVQPVARRSRPALMAELYTRLRIADGIELHYDATRYNPTVEDLLSARQAIRDILRIEPRPPASHDSEII